MSTSDPTPTDDRAIYRFEVPVDDQWHEHRYSGGRVLHTASRRPGVVEFWAIHNARTNTPHRLRAFGTGQPLPPATEIGHVGTVLDGGFVWHLMEDFRG